METLESLYFPIAEERVVTASGLDVPKTKAIVRTDTDEVLSVVSDSYYTLKHKDAITEAEGALDVFGERELVKVKSTRNGARIYVEYLFPETKVDIGDGDDICLRLIATNSYDRSARFGFMLGAYRYVCQNGAVSGLSLILIRKLHRLSLGQIDLLGMIDTMASTYENKLVPRYREMNRTKATSASTDEVIRKLLDDHNYPKRHLKKMKEMSDWKNAKTEWDVYGTFTKYLTHQFSGSYERELELNRRVNAVYGV